MVFKHTTTAVSTTTGAKGNVVAQATVSESTAEPNAATGTVQFSVNGQPVANPVKLANDFAGGTSGSWPPASVDGGGLCVHDQAQEARNPISIVRHSALPWFVDGWRTGRSKPYAQHTQPQE